MICEVPEGKKETKKKGGSICPVMEFEGCMGQSMPNAPCSLKEIQNYLS